MRVALAVAAAAVVGASSGCPRKPPPEPVDAREPVPLRPTLVRTWAELAPDLYPELTAPETRDAPLPTVGSLLATRDHDLYTRVAGSWGALEVIEFLDTDHPEAPVPAVGAWLLEPDPDSSTDDPLASAVKDGLSRLRKGDRAPGRRVRAVLLRDFSGSPRGGDPAELALALGEAFAPPWELCAPGGREDRAVAFHPARGLKLGFDRDDSKNEAPWSVDHIEFLQRDFEPTEWFDRKGYGGCEPLGTITPGGRHKEPPPSKDAS